MSTNPTTLSGLLGHKAFNVYAGSPGRGDDAGNSVRAQRAIADISNALWGNPCTPRPR